MPVPSVKQADALDDHQEHHQEKKCELSWGVVRHNRHPRAPDEATTQIRVFVCQEATHESCAALQGAFAEGQADFQHPKHDWVGKWECQQDIEHPADNANQDVVGRGHVCQPCRFIARVVVAAQHVHSRVQDHR